MEKHVGERIKELRQKAGLTQAELAEKLGFQPQTVSNWENGTREPDISALAQLASLFNVSLDFLLLGKVEEPAITLEDMDDEKRALFLIKRDDAKNFEKYGYVKPTLLVQPYYGRSDRRMQKILEAIYENGSVSIFKACLTKCLEDRESKRALESSGALAVLGDLDQYIRFCVRTNCVEGLKAINLKYFGIGSRTSATEPIRFHIRANHTPPYDGYTTPSLSKETLNYILSFKDLSKDILDYLSEIDFFRDKGNVVYLMTDQVIGCLYKYKYFDRLTKAIKDMEEYNIFAKQIFDESLHGSWYTGKRMQGGAIYFLNTTHSDDSYLRALVTPINEAFSAAKQNKDMDWLVIFNNYNKKLKEQFPELGAATISDDNLKIMELESRKNPPIEEIFELKVVKKGLINMRSVISSDYGLDMNADELTRIKNHIKRVKELKPFLKSHFISPYELILSCLKNKNGKELFRFAADLQCKELENAVIEGDKNAIEQIATKLFIPASEYLSLIERAITLSKNVHVTGPNGDDEEATERERKKQIDDARVKAEAKFIEVQNKNYRGNINKELYTYLINCQFSNIPLSDVFQNITLDFFNKEKERVADEYIEKLEDKIESLTHWKAMEKEYNKISAELNRDYLLSELDRGEADKVVVLICKRLQMLLQFKYGYTGDLFTMIDTLIDRTMQLHNCRDDEDNNYNAYLEEDRIFTKRIQLLHKLRMKRNNIVHPEIKDVEMPDSEIRECIDLVELLSK